jgi:hypothetical protein
VDGRSRSERGYSIGEEEEWEFERATYARVKRRSNELSDDLGGMGGELARLDLTRCNRPTSQVVQ